MSGGMNETETDVAVNYRLLKLIEARPEISQRELARELGLSLGKVNYCLQAFITKGWVKANNFRRSDNKRAYAYLLTPHGIEEKVRVTTSFFHRIEAEYEVLKREVEEIEQKRLLCVSEHKSATIDGAEQ
jgi:EPS-associated MarR family transcriptional regulator